MADLKTTFSVEPMRDIIEYPSVMQLPRVPADEVLVELPFKRACVCALAPRCIAILTAARCMSLSPLLAALCSRCCSRRPPPCTCSVPEGTQLLWSEASLLRVLERDSSKAVSDEFGRLRLLPSGCLAVMGLPVRAHPSVPTCKSDVRSVRGVHAAWLLPSAAEARARGN